MTVASHKEVDARADGQGDKVIVVRIGRDYARWSDRIVERDAFLLKTLNERFDVGPFESILPGNARMLKRSPHLIQEVRTHHELDRTFLPEG